MDTVEPSGYTRDPWGAQIEAGLVYGVGAADAKAQIAAMVYAIQALRLAGITLPGDLLLAFVVDEETGACSPYGTKYLLDQGLLQGNAAIIGEPGSVRTENAKMRKTSTSLRTISRTMRLHPSVLAKLPGAHRISAVVAPAAWFPLL